VRSRLRVGMVALSVRISKGIFSERSKIELEWEPAALKG
jgi:hypothetical protein